MFAITLKVTALSVETVSYPTKGEQHRASLVPIGGTTLPSGMQSAHLHLTYKPGVSCGLRLGQVVALDLDITDGLMPPTVGAAK